MINKNNKNVQITLDPESYELLDSLAVRFKTSKSIIIRNALKVYAAKKYHNIKLCYSTLQEVDQTELKPSSEKVIDQTVSDEEWNNVLTELNNIK